MMPDKTVGFDLVNEWEVTSERIKIKDGTSGYVTKTHGGFAWKVMDKSGLLTAAGFRPDKQEARQCVYDAFRILG